MSYNSTGYFYIYFRTIREAKKRVNVLFNELKNNNFGKEEVIDENNQSSDYYYQLSIENKDSHEYWDVYYHENSMNMVVFYEYIDKKNKSRTCPESKREYFLQLLQEGIIDVAKLYVPYDKKSKFRLISKKNEYAYYGKKIPIVFFIFTSLHIKYKNHEIKFNVDLNNLLQKYWISFLSPGQLEKVFIKEKKKYIKAIDCQLLSDLKSVLLS